MLDIILEAVVCTAVAYPVLFTGLPRGFAANRDGPFLQESPWEWESGCLHTPSLLGAAPLQ